MGVDFDLLVYPQDELECGICLGLLEDPIETPCGHLFCKELAITRQPLCPECRGHVPDLASCRQPNYRIKNMIDKVLLYCDFKTEGCTAQIPYRERASHGNDCQYKPVFCPFEGCLFNTMPKFHAYDIADHTSSCEYRIVRCRCGLKIPLQDIPKHQRLDCDMRETICDSCGEEIAVKDVAEHLKSLCPAIELTCPHHILGCSHTSSRRDLLEHLNECPYEALKGNLYPTHNTLNEVKRAIEDHNLRSLGMELSQLRSLVIQQAETVATLTSQLNDERELREALVNQVIELSTRAGTELNAPLKRAQHAKLHGNSTHSTNSSSKAGAGTPNTTDTLVDTTTGDGAERTAAPLSALSPSQTRATISGARHGRMGSADGGSTTNLAPLTSVVDGTARARPGSPLVSASEAVTAPIQPSSGYTHDDAGKGDARGSVRRQYGTEGASPRYAEEDENRYDSVSDITRLAKLYSSSPRAPSSSRRPVVAGNRDRYESWSPGSAYGRERMSSTGSRKALFQVAGSDADVTRVSQSRSPQGGEQGGGDGSNVAGLTGDLMSFYPNELDADQRDSPGGSSGGIGGGRGPRATADQPDDAMPNDWMAPFREGISITDRHSGGGGSPGSGHDWRDGASSHWHE